MERYKYVEVLVKSFAHFTLMVYVLYQYLERKDKTGYTAGELSLNKSKRFSEKSHDWVRYQRVGKYLEQSRASKRDGDQRNQHKMHWSWFLWPIMAPPGWYQYYFYVMPATIFEYPIMNLMLWIGYWGVWLSWLVLQVF